MDFCLMYLTTTLTDRLLKDVERNRQRQCCRSQKVDNLLSGKFILVKHGTKQQSELQCTKAVLTMWLFFINLAGSRIHTSLHTLYGQ